MDNTEALRRTGFDNRPAQRVEFRGGLYYRPPGYPTGGQMRGIRTDGETYPDGTWLTLERDGFSGWRVAGLSTHAASESMLPPSA